MNKKFMSCMILALLFCLTGCPNSSSNEEKSKTTSTAEEEPASTKGMDEMDALQAFYDEFVSDGTLQNLKEKVSKYGLFSDHRKNGTGYDTYKIAYTTELANVVGESNFKSEGNYVVIKFNLLENDMVVSVDFHKASDSVKNTSSLLPTTMNSLLELFASLKTTTSREEVDAYIAENGFEKYAFTHDSAYYIGYKSSAVRSRPRDREGEAVDINFVTSGDLSSIGMVSSAEYAVHTKSGTLKALEFRNGVFYYEGEACESGMEAVNRFLSANQNK